MIKEKNMEEYLRGREKMGDVLGKDSLENLKIIGMIGEHKDARILGTLSHLFMNEGKKVAIIDSTDLQGDAVDLKEILCSHMNASNGELEYAIIHLPVQSSHQYNVSNIPLDSIIHIFLGENFREQNHRMRDIVKNLSSKGFAIINVDDEAHINFADCLEDKLIITYGLCPRATITASSIEAASNLHFTCCVQRGITPRSGLEFDPMEFPVCIPNLGKEDIHDALATIGAGLMYGISIEKTLEALQVHDRTTKGVKYESR